MNTEQTNTSCFASFIAMESAYRHAKKFGSSSNMEICPSLVIEMRDAIIAQAEEIERLRLALQGIVSAHRHTYGLDGAWDAELKAAEEALTPQKGESDE